MSAPPSFSSFRPPASNAGPSASGAQQVPALSSFSSAHVDKGKAKAVNPAHETASFDERRHRRRHRRHDDDGNANDDDQRRTRDKDYAYGRGSSTSHIGSGHDQGSGRADRSRRERQGDRSEKSRRRDDGDFRRRRRDAEESRTARENRHSRDALLQHEPTEQRRERSQSPERLSLRTSRRSPPAPPHSAQHPRPYPRVGPEVGPPLPADDPQPNHNLYISDSWGDRASKQYGLDSSKVPLFDRSGGGLVVGLDPPLRITRQSLRLKGGQGLEVTDRARAYVRRSEQVSKSEWKRLRQPGRRLIMPKATSSEVPEDFIRVSRGRHRPNEEGFSVLGNILTNMASDRHSGDPTIVASSSDESDGGGGGGGDKSGGADEDANDNPHVSIKARARELHLRLRTAPTDAAAWLDLVDFQDRLSSVGLPTEDLPGTAPRKKEGRTERELSRASHRQAMLDVRLSILEKAFVTHPENRRCLPLVLSRLQLAANSGRWDSERLEREWRKVLKNETLASDIVTAAILWQAYLNWRRSDWTSFELAEISAAHADAIATFVAMTGTEPSKTEGAERVDEVLLSLTRCHIDVLRGAGFNERAVAAVQSLLEVNLCAPSDQSIKYADAQSSPPSPFQQILTDFETFWNSGQPRLMEEGARGWSHHLQGGMEGTTDASVRSLEASPSFGDQHPVDRWLEAELHRSSLRRFPARLTDLPQWQAEGEEIDAFSTVLFSDVRPLLFRLGSRRGRLALLDMALAVLGLPSGLATGLTDSFHGDDGDGSDVRHPHASRATFSSATSPGSHFWPSALRDGATASSSAPFEYIEGQMMERERRSNLSDPAACPVLYTPLDVEGLFAGSPDAASPLANSLRSVDAQDLALAGRLLDQVAPHVDFVAVQVLHLAIEAARSIKAAAKLARKLLSRDRGNHILWHAYAQLELSLGRAGSARTIYITALESSAAILAQADAWSSYLPQLWTSLTELLWKSGDVGSAVAAISAAAKSSFLALGPDVDLRQTLDPASKLSGFDALRTRKRIQALITTSMQPGTSAGVPRHFLHQMISCLALFDYLVLPAGQGFPAAMAVFDEHVVLLRQPTPQAGLRDVLERLSLKRADFMRAHVATGQSYRPADVRRALDDAVDMHPTNTILWGHLTAHEMRSKIDNHLRLALEAHLAEQEKATTARALLHTGSLPRAGMSTQSMTPWLFAIYVELNLHSDHFGEEAVRRTLDRAIDSCATSKSPAVLWPVYLEFEIRLLQSKAGKRREVADQLSRTKGLLFRAVKACPGNKSIYLFAFRRPLREAMELDEVILLYEAMCDKGIRLFVDLDDFLNEWRRSLSAIEEGGALSGQEVPMAVDAGEEDGGGSDYDNPFDPNKPYKKRDDKYEQVGGGGSDGAPMACRERTGFHSLPVELLYSIFVLARSSSLPVASRGLRDVFLHAPLGVKIEYVLEMWHDDHLRNLATWRDTRFRACSCGYRRAAGEPHISPPAGFWKRPSILSAGTLALCCGSHLAGAANVDPLSYTARFGICTSDLIVRLEIRLVQIDSIRAVLEDHRWRLDRHAPRRIPTLAELVNGQEAPTLSRIELPKRIFRALKQVQLGVYPPRTAGGGKTSGKKRRRNAVDTALPLTPDEMDASGYTSSLLSLFPRFLSSSSEAIGTLPSARSMDLLVVLLSRYRADANSHSGFPLAMSVHSDSGTLVNVLLAYGADPSKKEGLAIQIAMRKGGMDGLRTLLERDEKMERRWSRATFAVGRYATEKAKTWWAIKAPDLVPLSKSHATTEEQHETRKDIDVEPSSCKRRKLPDRFVPDIRHLREAIKADSWDVVHYLMHNKNVVPDMKALQLMERKGM